MSDFIHQVSIYIFAVIACYAGLTDMQSYRIPNFIPISLFLLFPFYALTSATPLDWPYPFIQAGCLLALGFFLYSKGWIGAGDVKFLSAGSLWIPTSFFANFLLIIGASGGIIAASLWIWCATRHWEKSYGHGPQNMMAWLNAARVWGKHQRIAYGSAISIGCLAGACQMLIR
ncbi:MAG: prepilin peptidase [Dongiaceae bacterium]